MAKKLICKHCNGERLPWENEAFLNVRSACRMCWCQFDARGRVVQWGMPCHAGLMVFNQPETGLHLMLGEEVEITGSGG